MPVRKWTTSGSETAALTQKRKRIDSYSGSDSTTASTSIGSSAMPQIGQDPGPSRITSGCIGQVYRPGFLATPVSPLISRFGTVLTSAAVAGSGSDCFSCLVVSGALARDAGEAPWRFMSPAGADAAFVACKYLSGDCWKRFALADT